MAQYTNAANELVEAVQLTDEEARAAGVLPGSWHVTGTGTSHSSAMLEHEAFLASHTPVGPAAPAKYLNAAGEEVEAVAIPAPRHWQVTTAEGEVSTLPDEEFQASHTLAVAIPAEAVAEEEVSTVPVAPLSVEEDAEEGHLDS